MTSYKHIAGEKIIEHLQSKLSSIRTGRVNASVLDNILVFAYGSNMHIREIATVTIPEPGQLMITPFDKGLIKDIEKAIVNSNLGVNPGNDGAGVRLIFPPMTEENRKNRVKEVGQLLEEARIMMRSRRQDILKSWKHQEENGEIGEDVLNRLEKELQTEIDNLNKELHEIAKNKEAELMTV